MSAESNLSEITDRAVKDISKKVARVEMHNADSAVIDDENSSSLVTTAKGDYELTIVFYTSICVMRAITENMKRGESADEEDIAVYTKEFFNILCGHVISMLNRSIHASARFGIPQFLKGPYREDEHSMPQALNEMCYQCSYGPVKIRTIFQSKTD